MIDAIGSASTINGTNVFEGVEPISAGGNPNAESSPQGPLSGVSPRDAGVDISSLMGNTKVWKTLAGK